MNSSKIHLYIFLVIFMGTNLYSQLPSRLHFHLLDKDSLNVGINTRIPSKPLQIHGFNGTKLGQDTISNEYPESTLRFSNGNGQYLASWQYIKSYYRDNNEDSILDSLFIVTPVQDEYKEDYGAQISLINATSSGMYSVLSRPRDFVLQTDTSSLNIIFTIKNDSANFIFTASDTTGKPDNIKMILKSNGNLGLGVENPQAKLDANGPIKFNNLDNIFSTTSLLAIDNNGYLKKYHIQDTLTSLHYWGTAGNLIDNDTSFVGTINSKDFYIRTNNESRLKIKSDGNLFFGLSNGNSVFYFNPSKKSYHLTNLSDTNNMGINSFAFGKNGYAKGNYSVAMGNQCTAKANFSFALGNGCNSDGVNSFAMGLRSNTNLKNGSFVISDNSSYLINSSSSDNQIRLRFSGDTTLTGNFAYEFYTDPSCSIGVKLEPYGSGWSTLSSRSYKENLQIIDYNELLEQFNNIDVFNWNYINSPNKTQYIGPVAQDFFKTFKIGYDSNYINSINIDGVNMAAIKGLYIKNSELKKVLDSLKLYLSDVVNKLNNAIILMSKNELQSTHIIEDATFHLNVYPNPTNVKSGIKVEYQLPSGSELCNIKIYDVLNRELLAFNNLKMGGLSVIDLSLNTFVKGSYKCVLFCGGNKMLIENFIVGE